MNYNLDELYTQATRRLTDRRPLIVITGNFGEPGCTLGTGYYESVIRAGGLPLIVPPSTDLSGIDELLQRADGLLLSGGADLNPLWMDQEPLSELGGINPVRDAFELLLARRAYDWQIPVLGICRGMQVLTVALGGTVHQDQQAAHPERKLIKHSQQAPRSERSHSIATVDDSLLHRLLGDRVLVNSFHHQSVDATGPHLRVTAVAPDGIVEAVESTERKSILGVQWHPECLEGEDSRALFTHFVSEAHNYRRARRWHAAHLTLDSHCDTPMFFDQDIDFNRRDPKILVDIHKMTEGGLDASIMVAYLAQNGRGAAANAAATAKANEILDRLEDMVAGCPQARMAYSPADLAANKQAGLRSVMPGIENAFAFGTDLANVSHFRRRGVVYATLCHNGNNDICDSARPNKADLAQHPDRGGAEHGGLSEFGRSVVREMNRVGMMVDLSHGAETSFYDALEVSALPIVCSHSSARALCNHPRNLTDDQLRALAAAGGVAQCTFYAGFLRTDDANATVDDALRHLLHMISVAGIDHVGIGTDFDGDGGVPGLANASELIQLTRRLQAEGFTDEDLAKIWGGNFLRVMTRVQAAAQS